MKVTRVGVVLVLSLVLVCGFQSLAAAQILKKATQLVNISSNSTTGILDGESWTRIMPDGTLVTPFTLPVNKVLVMSSFTLRFTPSETTKGPLRLLIQGGDPGNPTLFFSYNLNLNKDTTTGDVVNANLDFNFNPGLAIGVKPTIKIIESSPSDPNIGPVISGKFGMRIFGILP
jgi:hypothetical protein